MLLTAVLGLLVVTGTWARVTSGHQAPPSDPQAVRAAAGSTPRVPELGVQFHGLWSHHDRASRAAVLDALVESGARWVRLDVSWAMIQPRRGSYDRTWGVPLVDQVLAQAEGRGLQVLVTFWLTPAWANHGKGDRVAPDDPADYADALAWAARRWGDRVGAWEVWNEPNSSDFLVGADPEAYTELLCAAYSAVHEADDAAPVVLGGLMYNDDAWLRRAYGAGVRGCFDILGVHPYMSPSDAPPGLADNGQVWRMRHLRAVRRLMVGQDDRRPVWATEFGWSSHPSDADAPGWRRGVAEEEQAAYAVRAMRILGRDYPYVEKAFWYQDFPSSGRDRHANGYAMLRRDYSPKPVVGALRRLVG